jgi:hypothetical protein
MMEPSLLYRIASALLLLFAAAHTYGMAGPASEGAAREMVASIMRTVHFDVMGTKRTFWDFYFGFGMLLTAFLLFSAVLAWQLAALDKAVLEKFRPGAWALAVCHCAVAILCWVYFFLAPAIVATVTALCLVAAAALVSRD